MARSPQREIDRKARQVLAEILERINAGDRVTFERDFGGATATVVVGDAHTHVGSPGESFDLFVETLHRALTTDELRPEVVR